MRQRKTEDASLKAPLNTPANSLNDDLPPAAHTPRHPTT